MLLEAAVLYYMGTVLMGQAGHNPSRILIFTGLGFASMRTLRYKPVQKKSNRRPRMLSCEAMGGEAIAGIVPCCRTLSRQSQG